MEPAKDDIRHNEEVVLEHEVGESTRNDENESPSDADKQQYVPGEIAFDPYKLYLYNKAIRKGKEKERILRINIIGNYGQGKTSLARNLRGESSEGVTSTNGIEVNRYLCKRSEDGRIVVKEFENDDQDIINRIASVALTINPAKTNLKFDTAEPEALETSEVKTNFKFDTSKPEASVASKIPKGKQTTDISNNYLEEEEQEATLVPEEKKETELPNNDSTSTIAEKEHEASTSPEGKPKTNIPFSKEEYELFSDVIEKQNCQLENFLDIWDFGGQYVFYATHTLFHSKDALYLLVFDLTSPLNKIVRDEDFPNETGDRDMAYFAKFWIESIDAYTGPNTQVILVGTHKDELANPEKVKDEYFDNVRVLFDSLGKSDGNQLNSHIQPEDFVVDNKNSADIGFKELLDCISKKHEELAQTVEIPARWIQLEKALNEHKEKKVVSFQDVMDIDKNNKYSLNETDQVKLFLNYQHDKGRLFYFDDGQQLDPVVLDPKFLVDAFRRIITSEKFVRRSDARSEWKKLKEEGLLTEKLIDKVWSECDDFIRHKDVLLKFLKNHNILAQVVRPDKTAGVSTEESLYIVPSLLKDGTDTDDTMRLFLERKHQARIRYVLKFSRQSIVNMVFNRIVAATLGIWPVVNFCNTQLFFEHICVFEIQETVENISTDHAAVIEVRQECGTIELRILSLLPQDVRRDLADQLRRFVESFVTQEFRKITCYHAENLKPFSRAYRCNHEDHAAGNGSLTIKELKENENIRCPDNCTHDDAFYKTAKSEWFAEKTDETVYPHIQLTEKDLSLLSQNIGKNWELLGPTLSVTRTTIEHIKLDNPNSTSMQIYQMLRRWKNTSVEMATLDVLVEAVIKCPEVSIEWDVVHNIRDKFCRRNSRMISGFIQPLSDKICSLKRSLALKCKITIPRGEVTWKKNGQVLIPDGRIKTAVSGYHQTLFLENVDEDDAATYECVFGDAVTRCHVSVQDPADPHKFIKGLVDTEVGSLPGTSEFTCELNREVAEVTWYYRGQPISPSNKYEFLSTGTVHKLKIRDVTEKDEGKYRVVVGEKMSEAWLYVENTEEERNLLLEHYKQKEDPGVQLEFIKGLVDTEVGGLLGTAEFTCELNREVAEVTWYYRGQLISPSNKYEFLSTGTVHKLKIRDVTEKDEGKYRVVVEEKMSEAWLYVENTEEERNLLLEHYKQKEDLTPQEKLLLDQIRERKEQLLQEVMQLKDEVAGFDNESEDWSGDSPNTKQISKLFSIGKKKFNMDPEKGIEYLVENGILQNTPADVSQFLYQERGLSKTVIGNYLGEKSDFNMTVLKAFVSLHDFSDMMLVQALRQFFWSFRLPEEASKTDRLMECFADRYCLLNPGMFKSSDVCYVLSFAIIMLNTSLHNPSVKDKPTVKRFISMNRGISDGSDLPPDLLTNVYESIKKEPLKTPEDDENDLMHTFFNPDKEGWLWKQGGRYKNWNRRWFILNDNCLYYFQFTTDREPKGIIPLENIQVRSCNEKSNKPHCFELYGTTDGIIASCKVDRKGKVVEGKHNVYKMSAATAEEKEEWIKCIKSSLSENPFYDMLAARRKKAALTE